MLHSRKAKIIALTLVCIICSIISTIFASIANTPHYEYSFYMSTDEPWALNSGKDIVDYYCLMSDYDGIVLIRAVKESCNDSCYGFTYRYSLYTFPNRSYHIYGFIAFCVLISTIVLTLLLCWSWKKRKVIVRDDAVILWDDTGVWLQREVKFS